MPDRLLARREELYTICHGSNSELDWYELNVIDALCVDRLISQQEARQHMRSHLRGRSFDEGLFQKAWWRAMMLL